MFKKICRCGAIIDQGVARCKACQVGADKDRAKYQKEYDKRRPDHHKIYHTTAWKKVRQVAMVRDNYLCQECLHGRGRVVQATAVHHIDTLEDDRGKAYDLTNLISLCSSCHEVVHGEYERSKQDKIAIQQRLVSYID